MVSTQPLRFTQKGPIMTRTVGSLVALSLVSLSACQSATDGGAGFGGETASTSGGASSGGAAPAGAGTNAVAGSRSAGAGAGGGGRPAGAGGGTRGEARTSPAGKPSARLTPT